MTSWILCYQDERNNGTKLRDDLCSFSFRSVLVLGATAIPLSPVHCPVRAMLFMILILSPLVPDNIKCEGKCRLKSSVPSMLYTLVQNSAIPFLKIVIAAEYRFGAPLRATLYSAFCHKKVAFSFLEAKIGQIAERKEESETRGLW